MNKYTEDINRAVEDCLHYNLNEKESLEYIKKRVGKSISRQAYHDAKKRVLDNPDINREELWLNQFAKVGYVRTQRDAIEKMQQVVAHDWELFMAEKARPMKQQRKRIFTTIKLKDSIAHHLDVLTQFSQGSPIIAKVKALIDKGSKEGPEEEEEVNINNDHDRKDIISTSKSTQGPVRIRREKRKGKAAAPRHS